MKPAHVLYLVLTFLVLTCFSPAYALNVGDPFPDFIVANTLDKQESAYLNIPDTEDIQLAAIPYDVVIVEFLNVYCHTCRLQVPIFNKLKQAIEADPDLKDRVCLLGLAVGNSVEEIENFKAEFGAQYPILSDVDKVLFNSTGNIRGTPHTYVVYRDEMGFIVDYHAGGVSSPERYLDSLRHILRSSLLGIQPGNKIAPFKFKVGWKTLKTEKLVGEPYMMYFASSRVCTVEQDLRNMAAQLDVLEDIAEENSSKIFIFAPADKKFDAPDIPESLVHARDKGNKARELLGFADQPGVLCVNEYGRIIYRGESMTQVAVEQLIEGREYKSEPKMSSGEIQDLIGQHIVAAGHAVVEIENLTLENRQDLYVITVAPQGSGVFFFARLESDITMCDVCHDTHFVYIFDRDGTVTDFFPLEITKYGNVPWTDEDIAKVRNNLVGRSIFESFEFNPEVDAVTTATMSSSMVFESMDMAKEHFKDFYEYRFREAHWKNACFSVICKVKKLVETSTKNPDFVFDDSSLHKLVTENGLKGCPTGGLYIVLDGDVLCSQHGLNVQGCTQ